MSDTMATNGGHLEVAETPLGGPDWVLGQPSAQLEALGAPITGPAPPRHIVAVTSSGSWRPSVGDVENPPDFSESCGSELLPSQNDGGPWALGKPRSCGRLQIFRPDSEAPPPPQRLKDHLEKSKAPEPEARYSR